MSIEDHMKRLADSLDRNSTALEKLLASGKSAGAASKPADKAVDKPADKPAGKPAASKPAGKPAAGKKTPSVAVISERFATYMKTGDEDERAAAKTNVKALVGHYGAPKLTEIDPKHFGRVLEYLDAWEAGEEVEFDSLDDDSDSDDDDDGEESLV